MAKQRMGNAPRRPQESGGKIGGVKLTSEEAVEVGSESTSSEAVEPEEKTPEEIKVEKKARKKERNAAKKLVKGFMDENAEFISPEVGDALNLLIAFKVRKARAGISRASKTEAIAERFRTDIEISELDLFTEFKIGRQAMTAQRRMFIKKLAPDERIWVTFDEKAEMYSMIAEGADAPDGWDGYVPTEAEEL